MTDNVRELRYALSEAARTTIARLRANEAQAQLLANQLATIQAAIASDQKEFDALVEAVRILRPLDD